MSICTSCTLTRLDVCPTDRQIAKRVTQDATLFTFLLFVIIRLIAAGMKAERELNKVNTEHDRVREAVSEVASQLISCFQQ